MSQRVADYVACVRAQGAQLGDERGERLSADAGYLGIHAGGVHDVSESLSRRYTASDQAQLEIIRHCNLDAAPPVGGPLDRRAVVAALGSVDVAPCRSAQGPTGAGHARVMLEPDGSVGAVDVDGPPFAGTPVGACIARRFQTARIPPFAGGPVIVGKSFALP